MNRLKKALCLGTAVCLLTSSTAIMTTADNTFSDVPQNSPYYEAIEYVSTQNLFSGMGDNLFMPDYPFSRPMLMTVLWRLSGSPDVTVKTSKYKDVDPSAWYAKGITWATDRDITTGIGNGLFGVDMSLTREQFAVFMYRYAQYMGLNVNQGKDIGLGSFDDGRDVATYASAAVKWAYWNDIIRVEDNKINAKGTVSRGDSALGIYNFLNAYVTEIAVKENEEAIVEQNTTVTPIATPVPTDKPSDNVNNYGPVQADINSFPQDYYEALCVLSAKYPNWKFIPIYLDQDWDDAVKNEVGTKSLLEKSIASKLLLNKSQGFYTPETNTYRNCDAGGWVSAAENAVAYYMDPRNFLNELQIFQFELLSYNKDIHTIQGVESILNGTFMSKSQITYITTTGETAAEDMTYAEAIMEAARQSGVSPYYLASKIRNEVIVSGGKGSGSVSGQYGSYTGVYNFYNIGANDGADPISNGLSWASSGTTYNRPWNTPSASIIGGAYMIAGSYISLGQDTDYFQRFDVQGETRFVHQYMTSLTGAVSSSYYTYVSYESMKTLNEEKIFAIPIYQNMPSRIGDVTLNMSSQGRTGTITGDYVNIRSGPGTAYSSVGHVVLNDVVKISGCARLSNPSGKSYVVSDLQYPYWYHVSINGVDGYICADYVTVNNNISLSTGSTYNLTWTALDKNGNKTDFTPYFDSSNYNVATVDKNGVITAKGTGSAVIRIYGGGSTDSVTVTVE